MEQSDIRAQRRGFGLSPIRLTQCGLRRFGERSGWSRISLALNPGYGGVTSISPEARAREDFVLEIRLVGAGEGTGGNHVEPEETYAVGGRTIAWFGRSCVRDDDRVRRSSGREEAANLLQSRRVRGYKGSRHTDRYGWQN